MPMRILLVGDYPRDQRLGSTKVLVKLQEEFTSLGHTCDLLLADDLGESPRHRALRWAFAPLTAFAAVRRAFRQNGSYDVVDLASAEGLWVGVLRRTGLFNAAAIVARSNGIEHLNYQRMLDDHAAGLLRKPWTRRLWYPALRLSQVAAAARAADRLIVLNEVDRAFAVSRRWKNDGAIDLVPHGVSSRFIADVPPPDHPRGGGVLFCGTWDSMKGVHYLAAAFSLMVERGRRVNLTVLGGAMPAERSFRFSEAARPYVTVLDRLPEEDVIAALTGRTTSWCFRHPTKVRDGAAGSDEPATARGRDPGRLRDHAGAARRDRIDRAGTRFRGARRRPHASSRRSRAAVATCRRGFHPRARHELGTHRTPHALGV